MRSNRPARPWRLCRWALWAIACGAACNTACGARADERSAARALLVERGLTPANGWWLGRRELELRKRLDGLDGLIKRVVGTHQQADAMLQKNELLRAELRRLEALEKQAGKPPVAPGSESPGGGDPKLRPAERLNSQLPDVSGRGDETPLQAALVEWINARNALALALLETEQATAAIEREAAALAADTRVRAALDAAGGRLGPAKDYRKLPRWGQAAKEVFTASLPVYRQSGHWRLSALVDERTPATFSFVEQSQPTFVAATLAQALALDAEAGDPQAQRIGSREIRVRRGKLGSLRLGKFVFRDVPVWLLPPEAEDLGSQLATGALTGCRLRLTPNQMTLELESLAQAAPARGAGGRAAQLRNPAWRLAMPVPGVPVRYLAENWKTPTIVLRSQ